MVSDSKFRKEYLKVHKNMCVKCGKTEGRLDIDHIIPIGVGGKMHIEENVQILCYECHKEKTKKDMSKMLKGRKVNRVPMPYVPLKNGAIVKLIRARNRLIGLIPTRYSDNFKIGDFVAINTIEPNTLLEGRTWQEWCKISV